MKKNYYARVAQLMGLGMTFAAASAHAALDAGVTTAITTAAVDGAAAAAAVLLVFLGIKAVKWLRGAL